MFGTADGAQAQGMWTQLGGGPSRSSVIRGESPDINLLRWTATADQNGNVITFSPQAGVVATETLVYAVGKVSPSGQPANQFRVFAFRRTDGVCVWSSSIPTPALDSFSTPALDRANRAVIVASGSRVRAFHWSTGVMLWDRGLTRNIVNASPAVTTDLGSADRAFITDYDGFGISAKLYCINVDAFDAGSNPYQPGEIVWSAPIGASSGNSPAYLPREAGGLGLVYVATSGDFAFDPGRVLAFPVLSPGGVGSTPAAVWTSINETGQGFFGGVSVSAATIGGGNADPSVYAASYEFTGGLSSANMIRLNARTGAQSWSVDCNRSASLPIALPNGRVLLSAGINGFGSLPNVQLFEDHTLTNTGSGATMLWDSVLNTWLDTGNGQIDPGEFLPLGGWNQHPVVCLSPEGTRAFVGAISAGSDPAGYSVGLRAINPDVTPTPSLAGFVVAQAPAGGGAGGGSPAIAGTSAYSIGGGGLAALGSLRLDFDVDGDGRVSINDLYSWERSQGARDTDRDGTVTARDRRRLIAAIRDSEREQLSLAGGSRPLARGGEGGTP